MEVESVGERGEERREWGGRGGSRGKSIEWRTRAESGGEMRGGGSERGEEKNARRLVRNVGESDRGCPWSVMGGREKKVLRAGQRRKKKNEDTSGRRREVWELRRA